MPLFRDMVAPVTHKFGFASDTYNYRWRKWLTPRIEINGIRVQKFPFVLVEDAHHRQWAERYSDKHEPKEEVPF